MILLFFCLTGISSSGSTVTSHPILTKYVIEFVRIYKEECPNKPLLFPASLNIDLTMDPKLLDKPNHMAICWFLDPTNDFSLPRSIYVSRKYFLENEEKYNKAMMFHELTHCILNQIVHDTDENSYMFWKLPRLEERDYELQLRQKFRQYCGNK